MAADTTQKMKKGKKVVVTDHTDALRGIFGLLARRGPALTSS